MTLTVASQAELDDMVPSVYPGTSPRVSPTQKQLVRSVRPYLVGRVQKAGPDSSGLCRAIPWEDQGLARSKGQIYKQPSVVTKVGTTARDCMHFAPPYKQLWRQELALQGSHKGKAFFSKAFILILLL